MSVVSVCRNWLPGVTDLSERLRGKLDQPGRALLARPGQVFVGGAAQPAPYRRFGPAHAGGDAPEPEAVRLGRHVVSRRVALGYRTHIDLADSVQFTVRTLADIEHGVRKASPGSYAMLENKLAWAPGSIDTILAGGEPKAVVSTLHQITPNPPPQ